MPLLGRQAAAQVVLLLLAVIGVPGVGGAEADRLEVTALSGGGIRATAQVLFPARPSVVQSLLTDYQHWPDLFEVRMRVAELTRQEGVATVDLRIEHSLMPGERRLVTESRTLPNGGLVTDLKGGDFKQYHRVWKLQVAGEGNQTQADFELVVEPETLVPDRLIAMVVRQELETHFRIVKQKALERAKR
jgi:Polyketide cyclase / dehydrase and lipid transport